MGAIDEPERDRERNTLCFASVCCTQKKISVLLSATTASQAFLLAALPAQAVFLLILSYLHLYS